jgi:small subunit ribosomal protein S21
VGLDNNINFNYLPASRLAPTRPSRQPPRRRRLRRVPPLLRSGHASQSALSAASYLFKRDTYHLTCPQNLAITIPSRLDQFGGVSPLAEVRLQEGESLENALRRFKRKVQQEDIIKEVKRHSFYLKPGEKRRVKEALARKRSRKKARKEQE